MPIAPLAFLGALAEFDRKRNELLREKELRRWSGRVLLYVDLREGVVVDAGEERAQKSWLRERTT